MTTLAGLNRCPHCKSADILQGGTPEIAAYWTCAQCGEGFAYPVKLEPAHKVLPFRVWCECGHISGQHAAQPPHPCACNGNRWINGHGSICDCQAFKSPAIEALRVFLEFRDEVARLEHDCEPEDFYR